MTTTGELKEILNRHPKKWPDYTDVYIKLSVGDLEKILEALRRGGDGTKGINLNIKIHLEAPGFFISPDFDEETYLW